MKRFASIICLVFCLSGSFAQQAKPGVYLTSADFRSGRISFTQVEGKKFRIRLDRAFSQPVAKVWLGDSTFRLNKDSLFGYSDDGKTVKRIYERSLYTILNPVGPILLYQIQILGGHKNKQELARYYFSTEPDKILKPLNRWNLKLAFPANFAFHELLELQFHSDYELTGFDAFYNQFKVNHLLEISGKLAPLFK